MNRRSDLLSLVGEGAKTKRELEAELDVSRSTIDRGIRELADKDLVERTADGYRQTLTGRLGLSEYERFTRRVEGLCDGSTLLTELAPDAELDPAFLAGADVVESGHASPHRPIEELYTYVEDASMVRGFAPAVHPQQVETYEAEITERGMAAELVLTEAALERLLNDYADALETGLATDRVAVHRTAEQLSYSLTIATLEDRTVVGVMLYGDGGIHGVVLNDSPAAVEWAEERFEAVRDRATPLE